MNDQEIPTCNCGTPLIATFHWRGKEFVCLGCGSLYEFFDDFQRLPQTPALAARHDELRGFWSEVAPLLLTPGAKITGCQGCWGPKADAQHLDHATDEERLDHDLATKRILVMAGQEPGEAA